jgi:hypothetical protein
LLLDYQIDLNREGVSMLPEGEILAGSPPHPHSAQVLIQSLKNSSWIEFDILGKSRHVVMALVLECVRAFQIFILTCSTQ